MENLDSLIELKDLETGRVLVSLPVAIGTDPDTGKSYWHIEAIGRISGFKTEEEARESAFQVVSDLFRVMLLLDVKPSTDRIISTMKYLVKLRA